MLLPLPLTFPFPFPGPGGEEESVDMTDVDIFNSSRGFVDPGVVAGVSMTVLAGVVLEVELVGPEDGDPGAGAD